MTDTIVFLLFISGIFLLGFFGNIFFKKTKISDIFLLILVGLLLGPVFNVIPLEMIELLRAFTPIFAAIALIILLFDGGLYLNFYKVITEIKNAFIFTILCFILTVTICGFVLHFIFGFELLYGLMAGAIIGGISSAIIIPLVTKSSASDKTKVIMTLESAITDVFCVVATITIVGIIISNSASATTVIQGIFSAFAIATLIAIIGGMFWIKLLRDYSEVKEFNYLLTLAFLFVLYALTEFLNGNGAFCALVFGLVLGNASDILKTFKMKEFTIEKSMAHFQTEISLLIKTFFFVYLGIIIDIKVITLEVILITFALVSLVLIVRAISTKVFFSKILDNKDQDVVVALHARGLAAAVLATYPISMGLNNSFTIKIVGVAFLLIILTNVTTTVYFFIIEKKNKNNLTKGKDKCF
jgi:cell volume regulation protein A